jgi:hypothetical protein
MTLAFYEAKLGHRAEAETDMGMAESKGAANVQSQFTKAQALAALGRKAEAIDLDSCVRRGLSQVEVQLALDLKEIRSDRRYLLKSWILAICMLILGIVHRLSGRLEASATGPITPMTFSNVGEVFIHPKSGDVIVAEAPAVPTLALVWEGRRRLWVRQPPAPSCLHLTRNRRVRRSGTSPAPPRETLSPRRPGTASNSIPSAGSRLPQPSRRARASRQLRSRTALRTAPYSRRQHSLRPTPS